MNIGTRTSNDVLIVDLGEGNAFNLTGKQIDAVGKVLGQALDQGQVKILIDMEQVRLMDSAGIGALIMYKNNTMEKGGDVKLLRPRGRVKQVIELTKLNEVLEIHEDEVAAVASFA